VLALLKRKERSEVRRYYGWVGQKGEKKRGREEL